MRYRESELRILHTEHYEMFREICSGRACGADCPLTDDCPYNFDLATIEKAYTKLFGAKTDIKEDDIMSLLGEKNE